MTDLVGNPHSPISFAVLLILRLRLGILDGLFADGLCTQLRTPATQDCPAGSSGSEDRLAAFERAVLVAMEQGSVEQLMGRRALAYPDRHSKWDFELAVRLENCRL